MKKMEITPVEDLGRVIDNTFEDDCILLDKYGNEVYNIPAAFDIEVTSFFRSTGNGEQEKAATMYIWQFGLNGYVFMGRTWDEFLQLTEKLVEELSLYEKRHLIVYVHNLAYEFQFMRKYFDWDKVFSMKLRKPIYARTLEGIEFRCSYLLSGYSLAKLSEQLTKYPITKAIGDLDYDKLRHYKTPMTSQEINYCVRDVLVVMAYIQEQIERNNGITKIPLTKTGYVRNFCRKECYAMNEKNPKQRKYKALRFSELIKSLSLTPGEYTQLQNGFQGGFTHSNIFFHGKVVPDVTSFDFTSSYPTVMVAEKFPMSASEYIPNISWMEFFDSIQNYCCLFDVTFTNLRARLLHENYISISRSRNVKNPLVNNGRVVSADTLTTTITEQDYYIIREYYVWDKIEIGIFRRYQKGYLPTPFVNAILQLYRDKTTLKGVKGKEVEYLNSKEMLNACYGMAVTNIIRPEFVYGNDWEEPQQPDTQDAIRRYNKQSRRFLYYPWGVWVTAYARRNLFRGISEFGSDYIYSDTDSVKGRNAEKHMKFIEDYNREITTKLLIALEHHKLNPELINPVDIKGKHHPLGVWDLEAHYKAFKTLGAKRYMVQYDTPEDGQEYNLTISGLNKKVAIPYICDILCKYPVTKTGKVKYNKPYPEPKSPFDIFSVGMKIHRGHTGGNVHTYIDEPFECPLTDYMGNTAIVHELSCIHMEADEYTLSIGQEYRDFIDKILHADIED